MAAPAPATTATSSRPHSPLAAMAQTFAALPARQPGGGSHHHAGPHAAASSTAHRTGSMDRLHKVRSSDAVEQPAGRAAAAARCSVSVPPSAQSSASGSKASSFIGTPRLLSRRSSARDAQRPFPARSDSIRAKDDDRGDSDPSGGGGGSRSPDDQDQVIETAELRMDRDPGTGRKMINQYLVLHEIGQGTHGRVRLGRDMSVDVPPDELEADLATGSGPYYAIKIVERNPKKKRLNGLGRQRALGRAADGAKLVAENEMRKEIAIVKKLHHPNVVRMKEIIDDPDSTKLFMVFEYCEGGEVEWKGDAGPALSMAATRRIFRDTLLGLEYLHHQGIIHRDIKPSNLLRSNDHVKISDFGCSHFSEALFAAAAAGGEEKYVDDIELAKTAGSPAFFAPEMCFSDIPDEPVPKFTIRPPSTVVEGESAETVPFSPSLGAIAANGPRRLTDDSRSASEATIPRQRRPITNAIDVWALGVTLYCLLFGTTPFDAANEYLLMQAIPTAQYPIPATMGRDRFPTDGSNEETNEALDLLSRLLEKDAQKRITLDQAKHHPFTLRGLPNAKEWLAATDPHDTSYVTVTSDEVAAAVTRGGSIREKFKRGLNSISRRFRFGRNRSHSNTDTASDADHIPGTPDVPSRRVASGNDVPSTASVPATNLARRLSLLSRDRSRGHDSRRGSVSQANTPLAHDPQSPQSNSPSPEEHLRPPLSSSVTPRQMPSITSLDRFHTESLRSESPSWRGEAGDNRARSGSNASSSAGSILGALGGKFRTNSGGLAKARSLRTGGQPIRGRGYTGSSEDTDGNVFAASSFASSTGPDLLARAPSSEFLRGRSFDGLGRRMSTDAFEPSSPSSHGHGHGHGAYGHMSPERAGWFRDDLGPVRRGSTLSEDIRPVMEDEEVDWTGAVPDSDDEVDVDNIDDVDSSDDDPLDGLPTGHGLRSAPADWNLNDSIANLERKERARQSPVKGRSLLPPNGYITPSQSPHHTPLHSPHRPPPSSYSAHHARARSPLSPHDETPPASAVSDAFADADEDGDVVVVRRTRKGSVLSRGGSIRGRSPGDAL